MMEFSKPVLVVAVAALMFCQFIALSKSENYVGWLGGSIIGIPAFWAVLTILPQVI